jgi:hypothetical protein
MGDPGFSPGIDLFCRWSKHGMGTSFASQPSIFFQLPGVVVKILPRSKLQGVHKDAHQHLGLAPPPGRCRPSDQLEVTPMECPHGGHEMKTSLGLGSAPGGELALGSEKEQRERSHQQKSSQPMGSEDP